MLILILLVVLVTLSNAAVAEPLRLKNGARFRIRSVGPRRGVNDTQSAAPTSTTPSLGVSSASTSKQSPLQSSTASTGAGGSSKSQEGASAASGSALGTSVVFQFPNGVPAATIFVTTARPSTTLSANPLSESITTQLTTTLPTIQSTTTIRSTKTLSTPGQLGGDQPIPSPSATSLPLMGQPRVNQSITIVPSTSTTQTTAAGSSQTSSTTTIKKTSKVQVTFTIPTTKPTLSPIPTPQSNLEMARALNTLFRTLTSDSTCNLTQPIEAAACINGQLAMCSSSGTYSLSQCPQGKQCYALPKTGLGTGVEIGCDTAENAQLILGLNSTSSKTATISSSSSTTPVTSQLMSSTINSVPQPPAPTTTITFVPGSMSAPGLPAQLSTSGVTTTVTEFVTIIGSPPTGSTSLTKSSLTDQPTSRLATDEVSTTVTKFVTVTGKPPTDSTSLTKSSTTDQPTSQLPTDEVSTTVTKFITVTGKPPTPSAILPKSSHTDQPASQSPTEEVTTTVTKFITVTGSPPTPSTILPKSSRTNRSTAAGAISSLVLPSIATVTETVTSIATVTKTVTTTATVKG
ncbi:MAG: hypothetical protein M1839_000166 [Geoglossum umbratile]|nr:MAG: hypothetical protein M1839_000166 [Geoglossum umbratile]